MGNESSTRHGPKPWSIFPTLTMDGRNATQDVKKIYQYSFRECLNRWTSLNSCDQSAQLNKDIDLFDYQMNRLDYPRFAIKKDRDMHFFE